VRLREDNAAPKDRSAISDQRDRQDRADPIESAEPTDRIDPAEPMLPMEAIEPTLPMDSTEPWDPIDSKESVDHNDSCEEPVEVITGLSGTPRCARGHSRRRGYGGVSSWAAPASIGQVRRNRPTQPLPHPMWRSGATWKGGATTVK